MVAVIRQGLTERQLAVLERIDRRVPIKVIAQQLGVSETRVNQHIRSLKDFYQVDSLNELVECFRANYGDSDCHLDMTQSAHRNETNDPLDHDKRIAGIALSPATHVRPDAGGPVLREVISFGGARPL